MSEPSDAEVTDAFDERQDAMQRLRALLVRARSVLATARGEQVDLDWTARRARGRVLDTLIGDITAELGDVAGPGKIIMEVLP